MFFEKQNSSLHWGLSSKKNLKKLWFLAKMDIFPYFSFISFAISKMGLFSPYFNLIAHKRND